MIARLSFLVILCLVFVTLVNSGKTKEEKASGRDSRAIFPFGSRSSSLTRAQLFNIPNVAAVVIALSFLVFLLPFRMLRFNATNLSAQNKNKVKTASSSIPLTEEAARLTRKILDAIEKDLTCVNHTACNLGSEVKSIAGEEKQEIVLKMLQILLPDKWKPTVEIIKAAMVSKPGDEFCQQFACDMPETDSFEQERTSTNDWVEVE